MRCRQTYVKICTHHLILKCRLTSAFTVLIKIKWYEEQREKYTDNTTFYCYCITVLFTLHDMTAWHDMEACDWDPCSCLWFKQHNLHKKLVTTTHKRTQEIISKWQIIVQVNFKNVIWYIKLYTLFRHKENEINIEWIPMFVQGVNGKTVFTVRVILCGVRPMSLWLLLGYSDVLLLYPHQLLI